MHREWETATQTWSDWSGDDCYNRTMRASCVGSITAKYRSRQSAESDRTKCGLQMDCSDVGSQAPLLSVHEVMRIMRTVAGETASATWRRARMWTWDAVTQTDSTPHSGSRSPDRSNSRSQCHSLIVHFTDLNLSQSLSNSGSQHL